MLLSDDRIENIAIPPINLRLHYVSLVKSHYFNLVYIIATFIVCRNSNLVLKLNFEIAQTNFEYGDNVFNNIIGLRKETRSNESSCILKNRSK